jgi:hypothetical protein
MVDNRTPEANIDLGDIKPFATLFGGLVAQIIGARGDERNLPGPDERYDFKCPCHMCGLKYDTYVGACLSGMRHYSDSAQLNAICGSERSARTFANQSVSWLNEAQRAFKDKS